jgi:hypothetical protein
MTKEEREVEVENAKAAEKAAKEGEKARKEAAEAEKKRLNSLTFDERVDELRSLGYPVGREDATGLEDGTNARQTSPTEAKLTVVKDDYKYTVALDELDRGLWSLQAQEVGEILGVEFDTEELEAGNPEDANVKAARSAAYTAGGRFVPGKPGENPDPSKRVTPSGVSPVTTRGRGF